MNNSTILVVDDESGIRSTINEILSDEGYSVETAADASEAHSLYHERSPDLVLLDIWMPETDGITLLKQWLDEGALKCPVIIMSGHGTVETAVEATRLGAVDYIEKPLSLAQLLRTVENALADRPDPVSKVTLSDSRPVIPLIPQGKGKAIQAARDEASVIAQQSEPVLLMGEAGSGRELFARYVHELSAQTRMPFIQVSGASLTDTSALDQLVGAALSGEATGLLQQAEGGTLFISELENVDAKAQSFLSGLLEQGTYTRSGQARPEPANIRIMASLHSNANGAVRADLLATIGVLQLKVPPLRDYKEDIPQLLSFYVDRIMESDNLEYRHFSVAAQNRLRNYPWSGNLRELESLVRCLLLAGDIQEIGLRELEASLLPTVSVTEPLVKQDLLSLPMREAREHFERAYLVQQLALCSGKVGKLAERVGLERTHLYRKLRALQIDFGQGGFED